MHGLFSQTGSVHTSYWQKSATGKWGVTNGDRDVPFLKPRITCLRLFLAFVTASTTMAMQNNLQHIAMGILTSRSCANDWFNSLMAPPKQSHFWLKRPFVTGTLWPSLFDQLARMTLGGHQRGCAFRDTFTLGRCSDIYDGQQSGTVPNILRWRVRNVTAQRHQCLWQ